MAAILQPLCLPLSYASLLPWPRTLKHKALWALLLVALLALGNVATMQLLLRRSDDAAATLNIASNMRMLGQRIALETLAAQQDPFRRRHAPHGALPGV